MWAKGLFIATLKQVVRSKGGPYPLVPYVLYHVYPSERPHTIHTVGYQSNCPIFFKSIRGDNS